MTVMDKSAAFEKATQTNAPMAVMGVHGRGVLAAHGRCDMGGSTREARTDAQVCERAGGVGKSSLAHPTWRRLISAEVL